MVKNERQKPISKPEIKAVTYKFSHDKCPRCGEEACADVVEVQFKNGARQTASLFGCDPLHNAALYDFLNAAVN